MDDSFEMLTTINYEVVQIKYFVKITPQSNSFFTNKIKFFKMNLYIRFLYVILRL